VIVLYRGLVGFVLEYGSACYSGLARTYMLLLEKVQYRVIRIALGLMCSTPNNSLGVLSSIASLAGRFMYLNFRYLVAVFYRRLSLGEETRDPEGAEYGSLYYGLFRCFTTELVLSEFFTRLPALLAGHFVDYYMD
jgi:hypothetical protein